MIGRVLVFLKNHLNAHLLAGGGTLPSDIGEDKVVFVDGEKLDPITFKLGAVTALLINVEEENTLHRPDPYVKGADDGSRQRVHPDIRLNLYVLFVARFKQYEHGLSYLSRIIQYFQSQRVLNHHNAPALDSQVDQLVMELITLPLSEQNDIWSSLRTTYHPSVMYKVKMVVFRDQDAVIQPPIEDAEVRNRNLP